MWVGAIGLLVTTAVLATGAPAGVAVADPASAQVTARAETGGPDKKHPEPGETAGGPDDGQPRERREPDAGSPSSGKEGPNAGGAPKRSTKPAGPAAPAPAAGDPAWYDIEGQVRQAVAELFAWMVKSALKPVLALLGETLLSTPDLTGDKRVRQIWTGSLVVANAVFVLYVVAGGFVIASRDALQASHGLGQIAPRIGVAALAANLSLIVVGKAITAANAISAAIAGRGVDPDAAAKAVTAAMDNALDGKGFISSVLALAVVVMAIVVVITFILRIMAMVALIGLAPLALGCHALPQTEQIAYTWWRSLAACLAIQVGQAVVLLAGLRVLLSPSGPTLLGVPSTTRGLLGLLVCLTMLWLLVKVPWWTKQYVLAGFGGGQGRGVVGRVIATILMVKTLGRIAGIGNTRHAARPRPLPTTHPAHTTPRSGGPARATTAHTASARRRHRARVHGTTPPARGGWRAAGPAPFSHASPVHAPTRSPGGGRGAPAFSDAPSAPALTARPGWPAAPAGFSNAEPTTHRTPTRPSGEAPAARFSHIPAAQPPTRLPAAPERKPPFSHAPTGQSAGKRPPAPVAPVFSHPPRQDPSKRHANRGTDTRR